MAKKKKSRKQRRSAVATQPRSTGVAPVQAESVVEDMAMEQPAEVASISKPATTISAGRWGYVAADVRHSLFVLAICIAIELILWWFLSTDTGSRVYTWVNV